MTNCKIEESAETLLHHYQDDLEESLPKEMIHFSALVKHYHFNSECSIEIKMLKFIYENLEESLPKEMIHFSELVKHHHFNSECSIEIKMLKFRNVNGLMSGFPNVFVVLRMYLFLIISNCSGERLFSVLKRVNNQFRSTMGQKRLNSLALLCIENKILEK